MVEKRRPRLRSKSLETRDGRTCLPKMPALVSPAAAPTDIEVVYSEYRVKVRGRVAIGHFHVEKSGLGDSRPVEKEPPASTARKRRFVL